MPEATNTPAADSAPATTPAPAQEAPAATKPRSFKDIDEMHFGPKDEPPPLAPKKEVSDEEDNLDDDDDIEDDEDLEDGDQESDEESDEEPEEEEVEEEDEGEDKPKSAKEKALSRFDEEGKATFKVNGKVRKYDMDQIDTIVSSGASNLEWRRAEEAKIAESTKKLRSIERQFGEINERINPAWEAMKAGKIEDAFLEIASVAGKSRLEIRRELRDSFVPAVCEWLGLPPEWVQQRLRDPNLHAIQDLIRTKEENAFFREEVDRQAKKPAKQEQATLPPGVVAMQRFQAERGLTNEQIKSALSQLKERGKITGREKDFPVELVKEQVMLGAACDRAVEAILSSRPKLAEDNKFVDSIVKVAIENPDMPRHELARLVKRRAKKLAAKEAEKLNKDLSRKALRGRDRANLTAPNKAQPSGGGGRKPLKFSDITGGDELV